jgi:hypothetical protein
MPGRRFSLLAAISLLALIVCLGFWIYTSFGTCRVRVATPVRKGNPDFYRRTIGVIAERGLVQIDYLYVHSPIGVSIPAQQGWIFEKSHQEWFPTSVSVLPALFNFQLPSWSNQSMGGGTWQGFTVLIPFWLISVPSFILPAIWLIRYRRHRATRPEGCDMGTPSP